MIVTCAPPHLWYISSSLLSAASSSSFLFFLLSSSSSHLFSSIKVPPYILMSHVSVRQNDTPCIQNWKPWLVFFFLNWYAWYGDHNMWYFLYESVFTEISWSVFWIADGLANVVHIVWSIWFLNSQLRGYCLCWNKTETRNHAVTVSPGWVCKARTYQLRANQDTDNLKSLVCMWVRC